MKIVLPDNAVEQSRVVLKPGLYSCNHEWEKTETHQFITFRCVKCQKRVGYEVEQWQK